MILFLQALVGPLPAGFLRLSSSRDLQESADRQAALALYQQQNMASYMVVFDFIDFTLFKLIQFNEKFPLFTIFSSRIGTEHSWAFEYYNCARKISA